MAQKIELTNAEGGGVHVFINNDHWMHYATKEAAWKAIALHLAEVHGITVRDFSK